MYSIQKASLLSKIPSSTIRYYEKISLIPPIKRNAQEHRFFDEKDIEILNLIKCFRRLGMSIEDIRASISNINLDYEEVNTKTILLQHKNKLEEQIDILNSYIHEIDEKIFVE
ncbi:MerR family transcriptional regulator [Sporosarcina siberiensis]|uniref:MerR family transcriptional regulator n=1 Tax=Sporosarcina siberiensis TaxID=1365606 RepID=A0ABW4SDZ1_9BACL